MNIWEVIGDLTAVYRKGCVMPIHWIIDFVDSSVVKWTWKRMLFKTKEIWHR